MAEALETAITDNVLTCSICLEEFKDPRVLPCCHTFCYDCISNHARRSLPLSRTFQCPVCKEETQFPAGGLTQLKRNFSFCRTKEIITQERGRRTLEEEQTISCEKHPNNELKYYCQDDDIAVCGDCASSAEHYRHGIVPLKKIANRNRENTKAALVKAMKTTNMFQEAVAMETDTEREDTHVNTVTIQNIKKQAQRMCQYIQQGEEALISEVNSSYNVRKRQIEANKNVLELHLASLHSACDSAQELITNGTDYDIMDHAKPLIERLAVMEKTPITTPARTPRITFSPGEVSLAGLKEMLGQVAVQSPRPKPRSALSGSVDKGKCLHCFSSITDDTEISILGLALNNDYTFVVDRKNGKIKQFTSLTGNHISDIKMKGPFDVAVSQTGHLYITSQDDKCVKMYSVSGQFLTTMGKGTFSDPCGITVNRQGRVMVCDRIKKTIFTFHADSGQLLNTIPLSMCEYPEYISANSVNDNIVISDSGKHCVHVLSPTGDQLYHYGTEGSGDGQLMLPQGVCTDRCGHILIADCANNRIVALSPMGQFIRYIVTEDDGLMTPIALAIDFPDLLVVGEDMGTVKKYEYLRPIVCSLM